MKIPKASVVMSAYNEEKYISAAIESILDQTFKDFEFIIIDDGSTDQTPEIIKKYKNKDKRIKIITNKKNEFLSKSLNRGIKKACGLYIVRMDANDFALPTRLEKQIDFMENNSDIAVLGSAFYRNDEKKNQTCPEAVFIQDDQIKRILSLMLSPVVVHPASVIRKKAIFNVGLYNEDLRYTQDKDLWLRLAIRGYKFANLKDYLIIKLKKKKNDDILAGRKKFKEKAYFVNQKSFLVLQEKYRFLDIPPLPNEHLTFPEKKAYIRLYVRLGKKLRETSNPLGLKAFLMAARCAIFR